MYKGIMCVFSSFGSSIDLEFINIISVIIEVDINSYGKGGESK